MKRELQSSPAPTSLGTWQSVGLTAKHLLGSWQVTTRNSTFPTPLRTRLSDNGAAFLCLAVSPCLFPSTGACRCELGLKPPVNPAATHTLRPEKRHSCWVTRTGQAYTRCTISDGYQISDKDNLGSVLEVSAHFPCRRALAVFAPSSPRLPRLPGPPPLMSTLTVDGKSSASCEQTCAEHQ
jgi:hypothetical protein